MSELRSMEAFAVLRVADGADAIVVDLGAEPVASIEAPAPTGVGGARIRVDTVHELLVNERWALLHRSDIRDLVDIEALLASGGDLGRPLAAAPRKDGGFSARTLAWTLRGWNVAEVARAARIEHRATELEEFRDRLIDAVAGNRPES